MTKKKKLSVVVAMCAVLSLVGVCALCACSPQQSSESSSEEPEPAQAASGDFTFSMDADCVTCHTNQAELATNTACLLGNENHSSLTCATCHADESALASAHDGVAYGDSEPKRLKNTEVDDSICLTCHESYEALAEKTASSTALTDSKGTVVNPHEVLSLGVAEHESALTCTSCHEAHTEEPVTETAADACSSCHHTNVYECHTCHD